jgi:glycosyltransferase involved in cell wall biosynthesis
MRIAVLTTASTWAGAEVHAAGLAKYLCSSGHDAFLACIGERTATVFRNNTCGTVPIIQIRGENLNVPGGFRYWYRVFKGLSADVCIFEKPTLFSGTLGFDVAARLAFTRFVTIQQVRPPVIPAADRGVGLWRFRARLRGYLRSWAPHLTIGVSQSVCNDLLGTYWFSKRKTKVVYNGADSIRFQPDKDAYRNLRARIGVRAETIVFGSACRLSEEKGLDLGLRCFERLVASCPDREFVWVIAGEGNLRSTLETEVTSKGLTDRVFLIGFDRETDKLFPGFDFFLLPSRREGLPLSLIEAMAAGNCPIVTDVDGIPEVVGGTGIGWMVPCDDEPALFNAMTQALTMTDDRRITMAGDARSLAIEKFESAELFRKIEELATGCACRARRSPSRDAEHALS